MSEENSIFSVTPIDFDSEDESSSNEEIDKGVLAKYRKNAELDGYPTGVIEDALNKVSTSNCKSYKDFEKLIDSVLSDAEMESIEDNQKLERIKRSARLEISRLCKISDIAQYADSCIYNTYGTHSVTILDILKYATDEQLALDIYQEPIYSVIIQIDKKWVSEIVQDVMNQWSTKEYPKQFVEDYLRDSGYSEDEFESAKSNLLKYLSRDYLNDAAPEEYKLFKAVQQLLLQQNKESEVEVSDEEDIVDYTANLEIGLDEGLPAEAASVNAADKALNELPMSARLGAIYGKALGFKYRSAKNFEDLMYESMGEYGPRYKEKRAEVKAHKEELKEKKEEVKFERAKAREEYKLEMEKQKTAQIQAEASLKNNTQESSKNQSNTKYINKDRELCTNQNNTDNMLHNSLSSTLPTPVIVFIIELLVGLVCMLVMSTINSTMAILGLIIAFVGFLKKPKSVKDGLVLIAIGYLLFGLSIYLSIKVR